MKRLLLALLFSLLAAPAWATCASYPFTLTNGTIADATQVMANFNCAALVGAGAFTGTFTVDTFTIAPGGNIATAGALTTTGTGPTTLAFPSGSATYTFPSGSDTVTMLTASQTLTNKTLSNPVISNLTSSTETGFLCINTGTGVLGTGALCGSAGSTGTGNFVFATSPTLLTPSIGNLPSSVETGFLCINIATGVLGTTAPGPCGPAGTTGTGAYALASSPALTTPSLQGLPTAVQLAYVCINTGTGVLATDTTCGVSDERLKTDWGDVPGLSAIMAMHPGTFDWLDARQAKGGRQIGLRAQEVRKLIPEAVRIGGDTTITLANGSTKTIHDTEAIDYQKLVVPLIRAVQEQQAEIAALKAGTDDRQGPRGAR